MTIDFPQLTALEQQQLSAAEQSLAKDGRAQTFESLWQQWHILLKEMEHGYDLTIYDYTNDLTARDRIEALVQALPEPLNVKLGELVSLGDRRFEQLTDSWPKALLPRPGHWWRRVPKRRGVELQRDLDSQ